MTTTATDSAREGTGPAAPEHIEYPTTGDIVIDGVAYDSIDEVRDAVREGDVSPDTLARVEQTIRGRQQ